MSRSSTAGPRTSTDSLPRAGGRTGSPTGRCHRQRRTPDRARGQGRPHDPHRVRRWRATRSAPVSSPAWRGRAATHRVSLSQTSWRQSGWNCCAKSCPALTRVAVLVNPTNAAITELGSCETWPDAAPAIGRADRVVNASTRATSMRPSQPLASDPTPSCRGRPILSIPSASSIIALAARHRLPAISTVAQYVDKPAG